ncbi:MAG: hypothetical protein UT04_C0021G0011 [Candidatus Daviesbacteria bacterium GW2011_GWF2_38_7]|nr:MAG: hypothetical protein UT04_C0021G0011 [Candidatus Daviesbacteria bacterium GW2011_GWF2_38_7]
MDFANFFETNAFYPHRLTLLFSDLLLPQSLVLWPILYLTKNIILSFNLVFIISFILNYISLFLFWKQLFKKDSIAFFGSIFVIFSPFFQMELSHFQMISYWPFFFTLYFVFRNEEKRQTKNLISAGLLLTIQFLASVYLSVYLIFSLLIFYLLKYLSNKQFKPILSKLFIIFFVFLITGGIFIKGYADMKKFYNIKRDIKEYITYSANLSDYIFTSPINSFVHNSSLMQKWNRLDKNSGTHSSFPGFLIFILAIFALFKISKSKSLTTISLELTREKAFFLILIIAGFLFSLGPRLKFNGNYAHIPLPYSAVLEFIPVAEATRVLSRWSFLFFLGFTYFSLISLNKLGQKPYGRLLLFSVSILFILEYLPLNIKTVKDSYINNDYELLRNTCSQKKKVLLELPLTHLDAYPNVIEGLRYITVTELSSTYHGCYLVNGYSGYDLPENLSLANTINKYIENQQIAEFTDELRQRKIDIVKFNQYYFIKELKPQIVGFVTLFANEKDVEKINGNLFYIKRD